MLPPIPYLDIAGYKRRSRAPENIDNVEAHNAGFVAHAIAEASSRINARLKKRYRVPIGQEAPTFAAEGTAPPPIVLSGRPTIGSLEIAIEITTPGVPGVAVFRWSKDGGLTWTTGVGTVASGSVVLTATGLSALLPPAIFSFSVDNVYLASTPVPAIALGWCVRIVDVDVWDGRGVNANDPAIVRYVALRQEALDELKEAADSKDGLFDLPSNDVVGDSDVTQGGPFFFSDTSPYVWMDEQRCQGRQEDRFGTGTTISVDRP